MGGINYDVAPHESTHVSGGSDALLSSDLIDAIIKRLQESGGPTTLVMGAVADGQFLKRSGASVVGDTPTTASGLPTRFVRGLECSVATSGGTVVSVAAGLCRNHADTANITLLAADTADYSATGINGLDAKQIADNISASVSTSTLNANIVGTSTAFLSAFGTIRAIAGTFNAVSASTTVTGNGTKFLSDVAINDLIGNATGGWNRVTAIASDTSLTVVSAITLANASAGGVLENPTFQAGAQTAQRINRLVDDTHLTLAANSSATSAATTASVGVRLASGAVGWVFGFIADNGSTVKPFLSTQRTTPLGVSGYTSVRRIGSFCINSIGGMLACEQVTDNMDRLTLYEEDESTGQLASAASSVGSWAATSKLGNVFAPPFSQLIRLQVINAPTANGSFVGYVRPRGIGATTLARANGVRGNGNGTSNTSTGTAIFDCYTDGNQQIQIVNVTGALLTINVVGFWDRLFLPA